jgi:hypothetical protein
MLLGKIIKQKQCTGSTLEAAAAAKGKMVWERKEKCGNHIIIICDIF